MPHATKPVTDSQAKKVADFSPYTDLMGNSFLEEDNTSTHYTDQWGQEKGFVDFISNSSAIRHTPSRQLGWSSLFKKIREHAEKEDVHVYDAACGFGEVLTSLFEAPIPQKLFYIGADIQKGLDTIEMPAHANKKNIQFVRWDVSKPLPLPQTFDYIICRAAIHHTPNPQDTFHNLCASLKHNGTIAISVYTKKSRMREALDNALRNDIVPMACDEAFKAAEEFSELGKAFQEIKEPIHIKKDLNFLQIPAGTYNLQDLIYRYIVKCWYNEEFGDQYSPIVNYDWYHPHYAYRYEIKDIQSWFEEENISISSIVSTPAQHYIEGIKSTN